jgi:thiaminase/transcriptional activator TenA
MTVQTPIDETVERSACLRLRGGSEDIWEQIYAHPFLKEVEGGTLPDNKLLHYFIQNVHYIDAAIIFTAQAAVRAHDPTTRDFCFFITDFGREEVERQREYVRSLPGGAEASWEIAPTCHAYTRHLLTLAAYGGALDLLVGLSPCQWTYDEFGGRLAPIVKHPIHAQWLATFGSDEHHELSVRYNSIVDDLMASSTPEREADLSTIFRISSKYEWMFWEMAYTMEEWPI